MIKVITTLATGVPLMKEVIEGIAKQDVDYCLITVTSRFEEGEHGFANKTRNLIDILELTDDKKIIIMDSDVILKPNTLSIIDFFRY